MARDYIKIDPTNTGLQASLLRSYVFQLREALETGERVLAIMSHNNDGTVFTDVETLFGLPTGKGQTVFNLVNGSIGSMQGTFQVADAKNITEQVG
jgi:hypothetical protein